MVSRKISGTFAALVFFLWMTLTWTRSPSKVSPNEAAADNELQETTQLSDSDSESEIPVAAESSALQLDVSDPAAAVMTPEEPTSTVQIDGEESSEEAENSVVNDVSTVRWISNSCP